MKTCPRGVHVLKQNVYSRDDLAVGSDADGHWMNRLNCEAFGNFSKSDIYVIFLIGSCLNKDFFANSRYETFSYISYDPSARTDQKKSVKLADKPDSVRDSAVADAIA